MQHDLYADTTLSSQAAFIYYNICFFQECQHHHPAKCRTTWPGKYLSVLCGRLKCTMLYTVYPYLLHGVVHGLCVLVWVSLGYTFNFTEPTEPANRESSGHILDLWTGLQGLNRRNPQDLELLEMADTYNLP